MKLSKIEWTDHTWNPWEGCTKVSPGCLHCYAEHNCVKRWGRVEWGPGGKRRRVLSTWNEPYKWHREALKTGKKARVFCASLADIFDDHPSIQPEWRAHVWKVIRETPCLDWLLLTKRPENFAKFLPDDWGEGYPNVCLMVTVENQEYAERRIPTLLQTPARRRGLSVEPLIGPVYLSPWIDQIDWVIAGGESHTGARPMNPNWVREIRDLCDHHHTPFLFKQWGWWTPDTVLNGTQRHVFPDGEVVHFCGNTKQNGNRLDGEQHLAHPFCDTVSAQEYRRARGLGSGELDGEQAA